MSKRIEKFWRAKVILVTLAKPYFRIANPDYFDNEGRPVFTNLENDQDLIIGRRELEQVERLVEEYFGQRSYRAVVGK